MDRYLDFDDMHGEVIAVQNDKKFTTSLEDIVSDIMTEASLTGGFKDMNLRTYKRTDVLVESLEKLLLKRFGIPYRIIGTNNLAYTIPLSGSLDNIVNPSRFNVYKMVSSYTSGVCKSQGKDKDCDLKTIDLSKVKSDREFASNEAAFMAELKKSFEFMHNMFADGEISVDYDKAYIYGLEKKAKKHNKVSIMGLSFVKMAELGKTVRQVCAIILHEVGHNFNEISHSAMYSKTVLPMLYSFFDDKYSKEERAVILVEKVLDEKLTTQEAIKRAPEAITVLAKLPEKSDPSFYNNEIGADIFSARFGYGADVVMALNEMHIKHERELFPTLRALGLMLIVGVVVVMMITFPLLILFNPGMLLVVLLLSPAILLPNIQDMDDVHEQSFARTRRIKLELIRQLRTNKNTDKETVKQITDLMTWLEGQKIDKQTAQIIFTLVRGNGRDVAYHEMYQRMEQLSENDIVYQLHRARAI